MEEFKKQTTITIFLIIEVMLAYALINNLFGLPEEMIILIAPILIQTVKEAVKRLKIEIENDPKDFKS
jgi:hypothetical protein